jgi:hypothetical protein
VRSFGRGRREAARQIGAALGAAWLLIALPACSSAPPGVVPVSGRVTLDGEPLAGAVVTFQPIGVRLEGGVEAVGSSGRTNAEGRFVLTLIDPKLPGALAGRHAVTITTAVIADGDAARPSDERVPARWRDGSMSIDVPPQGTTTADVEMRSDS